MVYQSVVESFPSAFYKSAEQKTLKKSVSVCGIGVHSGQPACVVFHPAKAGSGITFLRKAPKGSAAANVDQLIPAHYHFVGDTKLCTILGDRQGLFVATVEHLLAALRGLEIDNVRVEIDGPEVPVMDGSSWAFVKAIAEAGFCFQSSPRRIIRILKPVKVRSGNAHAELRPFESSRFDVRIDFANPLIGRQRLALELTPETFIRDISRARTFGFLSEGEKLRKAGYARGSSLQNSIVVDENRILNGEGLRYEDEFVRHKLLDAVGDLALAGAPILGEYVSVCGGHKLNLLILKALFANPENWRFEELELDLAQREYVGSSSVLREARQAVSVAEI